MDWIELLFVIIFFGVPLLGRVLQRNAPPQQPLPPPPPAEGSWAPTLPAPRSEPLPAPAQTQPQAGGGWSAGWGEWPGLEADTDEDAAELAGESIAGDHDLAAEDIHTAEARSLEPVARPEAVVRALPGAPASLEAVEVDWGAEHKRFHDKYFKPPPPPPPRLDRLADHLRSRDDVRRAVLLAEVLGPPRSLREIDGER